MLGMYTDLDVLDMYMMDVEMDMDMMVDWPLARLYRVPLLLLHLLLLHLLLLLTVIRASSSCRS